MAVKRFGVSLEDDLLTELDRIVSENRFANRSQAIRHMIRKNLVEEQWESDHEVTGALVLVYDHHKKDLQNRSTQLQHGYHDKILAMQHVHLDHDNCIETIIIKGKASELRKLADSLIAIKGIKYGKLVTSAVT
jgi:CopG family nickel-responsive transcriptional regulator